MIESGSGRLEGQARPGRSTRTKLGQWRPRLANLYFDRHNSSHRAAGRTSSCLQCHNGPAFQPSFCVLSWVTGGLGITLGFHRLLTHSSFKTWSIARRQFSGGLRFDGW